jgi:hypothetical protein
VYEANVLEWRVEVDQINGLLLDVPLEDVQVVAIERPVFLRQLFSNRRRCKMCAAFNVWLANHENSRYSAGSPALSGSCSFKLG